VRSIRGCAAGAAFLASLITVAPAQVRLEPTRPSDPSLLHQQPSWVLSPPATGLHEATKGVRTIRVRPEAEPVSGRHFVQLSSQRTAADTHAFFDALQGRLPTLLGNYQALIQRTDQSDSARYRILVGPLETAPRADMLCTALKVEGLQCVVRAN
jgi:cell division septation protein DedD